MLTARPYAWPSGPDPAQGVYALADLNDLQIEQFIRAWYAALVHLAARGGDLPAECARLARADPGHWQVVLPLAARLAKADRGASAADELVSSSSIVDYRTQRQPAAADWTCALLAGMQLQEIGLGAINKSERTRAIATRVAGWLAASLAVHPDEGGTSAVQRAQVGDVLAALGAPRFDPERFYLPADDRLGFVRIPADPEFRIGTRKADAQRVAKITGYSVHDDEINDVPTPTPEFYIARYPVTVAQFRAFVAATDSRSVMPMHCVTRTAGPCAGLAGTRPSRFAIG